MYEFPINDLFNEQSVRAVELRRVFLSRLLHSACKGAVRYGPLKGFVLDKDPSWEPGDIASKLFGLYEQEVLQSIRARPPQVNTLINLGAADGYYGVGLVGNGIFSRSVCYEATEIGREVIAKTAAANGVAEKVYTKGTADSGFASEVEALGISLDSCLVLCDIEGGEFDVFSPACLAKLCKSVLIIELHAFMVENGEVRRRELLNSLAHNFSVTTLTMGARDLSVFPELAGLSDTDRWLICSEGRQRLPTWLRCDPLGSIQKPGGLMNYSTQSMTYKIVS